MVTSKSGLKPPSPSLELVWDNFLPLKVTTYRFLLECLTSLQILHFHRILLPALMVTFVLEVATAQTVRRVERTEEAHGMGKRGGREERRTGCDRRNRLKAPQKWEDRNPPRITLSKNVAIGV